MLFQCKVCGPATDHGSAPKRAGKAKPWRTIDIHCHCMVPEANAMVLKATGIPGGGETPNANAHVNALTKSIQPQRGKIDFPKLTDLDTRLADMDRDGIDVQVISPYPGHFVYAAPPEVARDSCHMVNDHIAGMVAKHPDRLMGMGTVPLQDPGMAVTELNRTVKELGFRGVELCTNVRGVRPHSRRAGTILRPRRGARRDDLPAPVRHQPGRPHGGSLFSEHDRASAGFPRCASDTSCSTAISNAFRT